MINRKDSCVGITLFRFGRYKLELWFVPRDYACEEHTHELSSGEFFVLYGKDREIWRTVKGPWVKDYLQWRTSKREQYNISNRTYFKWLSVRAGTPHGFSRGATPMVFLTLTKWKKDAKITSPAIDFHPITTSN